MLYDDVDPARDGAMNSPLLAHYTSLENLENILSNEQVWLSNPLFMNDLEEVRFGINAGVDLIYRNDNLREALGAKSRAALFYDFIDAAYDTYGRQHVLDLYVMCFSVHDPVDYDGRLSMWRGYGANGKGAALVVDVSSLEEMEGSPLALAPVDYASNDERKEKIANKIDKVAAFVRANEIADNRIGNLAQALFDRLCVLAIFSKHRGFDEEQEWRLAYFKDRDRKGILKQFFSYSNGLHGLHPKLKLEIKPLSGALSEGTELTNIIDRIIIGPSASSPIAKMAGERMLRSLNKEELIEKLHMSSIPFRSG
ncbi:DUF2971 domain-containing protein [Roseobacter sp. EG26]|uniref:DUF2971 domain-containing protein n=1 Tax=Roseobacter sp. EG26 TaxID=3412477 RepID=UPI003CE570E0